jgi:hypothetical protein
MKGGKVAHGVHGGAFLEQFWIIDCGDRYFGKQEVTKGL